jgi:anti-anti-sigma factor
MITSDDYNGVCVLTLNGDFSGDDCRDARRIVEQTIDTKQIVNFAVDLDRCPFMDSEGLETLLWIKGKCDEMFGMMKVVNPDESCRKIFEITRLESRFDVERDLAHALKAMR